MAKYDYLLFDVDNTLLDFHRAEHDAIRDCLLQFGLPCDDALIKIYSAINDRHWKMLERGEIDRPTLLWHRFAVFAEECSLSLDPHAFDAAYVENLSHKGYLLDGALEVCRALADRYTLCTITNGNTRVQHGRFDPSPLRPLFSYTFISDELGVDKPAQGFFDRVCAALPSPDARRMLVIGDSLTSDIAGGIRWGTDTCWVCPDETRHGDAAARGLQPTYTVAHLRALLDIL